MKLTPIMTSINQTKEELSIDNSYSPFIVNRCLSFFIDTIYEVADINCIHGISKKMHYDYLRLCIRPRHRFHPWMKAVEIENLEVIKEYYDLSDKKAIEALEILSDDDIQVLRKKLFKGGKGGHI